MVSPVLHDLLRPQLLVLRLLWTALTVSIAIYVAVAWLVVAEGPLAGEAPPAVALVLGAVALTTVVLSFLVPRLLLSDERLRALVADASPDVERLAVDPRTQQVDPERQRRLAQLSPGERRLLPVAAAAQAPLVVRLALNEAVAIFGFVLALLTGDVAALLPFAAVALVLNVLAWPRLDPLLERARTVAPA